MPFDFDDDCGDGFGRNQYARESAAINQEAGHKYSCAYAGGGDCTCGLWAPVDEEEPFHGPPPWGPPEAKPTPLEDDDCPF